MAKRKLSKRTKMLATFTAIGVGAVIMSVMKDKDKSIKVRNSVIATQDFYICELEQFIVDNVPGYDFSYMVGIPE